LVHLEQIKRQFGARTLFEEVSWMIPSGARLGLVGPNGSGKTTLLRLIVGEETPDAGRVHHPRDLRIGYLSQEVETIEGATVLDVALSGFEETLRIERRLREVEHLIADVPGEDPRVQELSTEYGALRERFEQLEGDRARSRAERILSGLGIPSSWFDRPPSELSGGWRMRVVLARLLLSAPGLLLLDEPTNHLDLEAIAWLEEFLQSYEGAIVIVSHDRYFLNRMARGITEIGPGGLVSYSGDYDDYVKEKQARAEQLEQAAKRQAKEIQRVERFIERFRYKNTKSRQVQSRIRALEKVERVQTTRDTRSIGFGFPAPSRSGDIVVRAEAVKKRFGETVVYDGMDLLLRRGDRVALVGPNGAGKSTLLKLLAGRIQVDAGVLELGHNVGFHYYAQHQLDALDPTATVLEEIERVADPDDRPRLRSLLGRFLFRADDVDKRVGVLSGGEKARLALARMLIRPANLLLLDEPTNHLDVGSAEMLENAINEYTGTLLVVSHDRYFINRITTSIGVVGGGRIELIPGDYDEYLSWQQRSAEQEIVGAESTDDAPRDSRRVDKRAEAEERNQRYRRRKAAEAVLAPIEKRIAETEQRIRELEEMQANPDIYSDRDQASLVGRERSDLDERLARLYVEWEEAASHLHDEE